MEQLEVLWKDLFQETFSRSKLMEKKWLYINNLIMQSMIGIVLGIILIILNNFISFQIKLEKLINFKLLIEFYAIISLLIVGYTLLIREFVRNLKFIQKISLFILPIAISMISLTKESTLSLTINIVSILGFVFITGYIDNILDYFDVINIDTQEKLDVYESRKDNAKYLKDLLTANEKNMILIDGEWGIGKSYFVDSVIKKIDVNYHKIFVDVLLFSDKEQLINHTLNEINTVLVNAGIRSNAINKYKGILKVISESSPIKFGHFLENDSLEVIENNIEKDLEKLGKPIYVIVDNLERVLDKRKIIDILGFLHKIYDISSNKAQIKIMTLADSTKILGLENMPSDYLDKFFSEKLYVVKAEKNEILNCLMKFIEDENSKFQEKIEFKIFNEALVSFQKIKESIFRLDEYNVEFSNYCRKRMIDIESALENPRNMKKIISDSLRDVNNYNYSFMDSENYQKNIFIIQIIISNVYLKFLPPNDSIFLNKEAILNFYSSKKINLDRPRLEQDQFKEVFLLEYFSSFMDQNMYYKENELYMISSGFYKIIKKITNSEEKIMLKQMKDILENEDYPDEYREKIEETLMNFNEYINYYNKNNEESLKIFEKIVNNCIGTTELNIKKLFNVVRNKKFLEINKLYYCKYQKSILERFNSYYEWRKPVLDSLREVFLFEFYYFAKKYLDFEKNIENINCMDFFEELPSLYWKKYNTNHVRFAKIVRRVKNSSEMFDEFTIKEMNIYNELSKNLEEDNVLSVPYFKNIKIIKSELTEISNIKGTGFIFDNIKEIHLRGEKVIKYIDEDFKEFIDYALNTNTRGYREEEFNLIFNQNFYKYINYLTPEFYDYTLQKAMNINKNIKLDIRNIDNLLFSKDKSMIKNIKNIFDEVNEYGGLVETVHKKIEENIYLLNERIKMYNKEIRKEILLIYNKEIEKSKENSNRLVVEYVNEQIQGFLNSMNT